MVADSGKQAGAGSSGSGDGRRNELIEIAVGVISDRGLSAASFRTLAREAGTSTMAFTYEFGSREEMLEAIINRSYEVLWGLRGFDVDDDADDPLGKLRRAATLAVQTEPEINPWQRTYDRFVFESPYEPGVLDRISRHDSALLERYVALIDLARERGEVDPGMPSEDALFMIWALGDGLNIHRYAYPEQFDPDRMRRLFEEGFDRTMGVRDRDRGGVRS